ncbi:MAG: hypothetical protein A2506_07360 [Elusimicrobia bacterium RIFOXYD12_FULL_66_9]|nr:MAG: hypothetical protein A2506_07360 [Elusimicrobia bacterium RIFOXYD12_FULL_66_9]
MERGRAKKSAIFFVLLLALPALAKKPRSLNWRMRPKPPVEAEVEESTSTAKVQPERVTLMPGRWKAEVREALEKFILRKGRKSPDYDAKRPPVAVIPWSDAAVSGDPAELVFLRLVTDVRFEFKDDFWEIIPVAYGRQPTRAAYEQFIQISSSVWKSIPTYDAYRKNILSSYIELCRGVGRKECRSYLSRLWAGWRDDDAYDFSRETLEREKNSSATLEVVRGDPEDRVPLRLRRGLRLIPEVRDLVAKLREEGFDVWVIDDVPQPVLAASAVDYHVDPSRVYGVHNSTAGPRMGAGVLKPVPTRGGKTEVLQSMLGRPADLVLGRDSADFELLSYGEGLRIVFDRDEELVRRAAERSWLVQPSLAR